MDDLVKIIEFFRVVIRLKETYRFTPKGKEGFESDADHSWNVALVCMILTSRLEEEFGVKLNTEKMLKMALIHDIAEILTGDTKTWDAQSRIGKDEREQIAITQIVSKLPEDLKNELLDLWHESETKETLEAKIVKSIDRLEPVMHRLLLEYGWDNLKGEGEHSTPEALDQRQLPRHEFSKLITQLYEALRNEAIGKGMFPNVKVMKPK